MAVEINPRAVKDSRSAGARFPSPLGDLCETLLRAEWLTAVDAGSRLCSPADSAGARPLSSAILCAAIAFKGIGYRRGDKGVNPPALRTPHGILLPWYPLQAHEDIASGRVISLRQFVILVGDIVPPDFDQPVRRQRPGHEQVHESVSGESGTRIRVI